MNLPRWGYALIAALFAFTPTVMAKGVVFDVPASEEKSAVAAEVETRLGEADYVLGTSAVSQREVTAQDSIVRIHLQFQTGEQWFHNQTIIGRNGESYVIDPADMPYGVDFPDETTYLRITAPPTEAATVVEAAERIAAAIGIPPASPTSNWTQNGTASYERVFTGITTLEPGFYLDCRACEVWTRAGEDASTSMNSARALVLDGRVVLLESTRWVNVTASSVLDASEVESKASMEVEARGYGTVSLNVTRLALEGDRLLYRLVPIDAAANLTEVHMDALTGEFIRIIGPPSGGATPPPLADTPTESRSDTVPSGGIGTILVGILVVIFLARRRRP